MGEKLSLKSPLWPSLVALSVATGYLIALLAVEEQSLIIGLLVLGILAVLGANLPWFAQPGRPELLRQRECFLPLRRVGCLRRGRVFP